jgi:hypothetical protein
MDPNPVDWTREFAGSVVVTDPEGLIRYMNERACQTFAKDGGAALVGRSVFDCHPEPARTKLRALLAERRANVYTIEKGGKKKLIYQSPWYQGGAFAGLVELSLEIPFDMPHFVRRSP